MKSFTQKLYLSGRWVEGGETKPVRSPWSGEVVNEVSYASAAQMREAIDSADAARVPARKLSRYARSKLLAGMVQGISARREDLIQRMVQEAGKPRMLADVEVSRAIQTFTLASEEVKRFSGEIIPLDLDPASRAFAPAQSYWVPRGPVLAITPFNFPLNLVAHKVAPSLAVGAPVLLKPAPQAPGASAILAEIFEKAAADASDAREKIPLAMFQVLSCANDVASIAVEDGRLATLSFTGSAKVGWQLQRTAVGKKTVLELGGNAGVYVDSDADLARAAARCAFGGYTYAGQVCISVQRILVHESVSKRFSEMLLAETAKIKFGDPALADVISGPVIDAGAADRIESWVNDAVKAGAKVIAGGTRQKNVLAPTMLRDVPAGQKLSCEEVFGPVVVLETVNSAKEGIARINDSRYGLQAGVFTGNFQTERMAVDDLEVGGLLINEIPTFRADNMPYGGLKESGLGREGVRYAMEDFCDRKTIVTWVG